MTQVVSGTTRQDNKTQQSSGAGDEVRFLVTSFAHTFISRIFMLFAAFLLTVVTARLLGAEGRGAYVLAFSFFSLLMVAFGLGVDRANVFFAGKGSNPSSLLANSLLLATIVGVPVCLITYFFQLPLSRLLSGLDPKYIIWIGAIIPFQLFYYFSQHILLGQRRIAAYNLLRNFEALIQLLILIALVVVFSMGVAGAVISMLLSSIAALVVVVWLLREHLSLRYDFPLLKQTLGYGAKAALSEVTQFFNFRLDLFVIAFFLNLEHVGVYSIAVSISQILWNLPFALGTVIFSQSATSDANAMNSITPRACRTITGLTSFFAICLLFSGPFVLSIFGSGYASAITPLRLLLPGVIAYGIGHVLHIDLAGRGRPEIGTIGSLISFGFTVVLDFLLIPAFAISGAAIASTLAYIGSTLFILISFCSITKLSPSEILIPRVADMKQALSITKKLVGRGPAMAEGAGE